jgi:hypothetical protein
MKSLKANNYEKAVLELNEFEKGLGNQILEEVKPQDASSFHVALVRVVDKPGAPKNDVSVQVQHYSQEGFEKLEKNYVYASINKIVLVHDPRKNVVEVKETEKGKDGGTPALSQDEITKQIEEQAELKANEKFEAYKRDLATKDASFVQSVTTPVIDTVPATEAVIEPKKELTEAEKAAEKAFELLIAEGTAPQLKEYAEVKGIDLTGNLTNKGTILGAIKAWGEDPENEK